MRGRQHLALNVLALLINPYLYVTVTAIQAVTFVAIRRRFGHAGASYPALAAGVACVLAVGLSAGYGTIVQHAGSMRAHGFGRFSWNVPTLVVPPSLGGLVLVERDATDGQYEGEAYIGLAALVLLAACLITSPRSLVQAVGTHSELVILVAGLSVLAASNRVYFGSSLVLAYPLPRIAEDALGMLRGTGRLIWPLAYLLMVAPAALLACHWSRRALTIVVVVLVALQVRCELLPDLPYTRAKSRETIPDIIGIADFTRWVGAHERVFQFPSIHCGGLDSGRGVWGGISTARQLQLQLLAARSNRPMNSIYMSRSTKDCAREVEWAQQPSFEDDVLYVIGKPALAHYPLLAEAATSDACRDREWAFVCSTSLKIGELGDLPAGGSWPVAGGAWRR
jgi:hypothetical protein